jgi:hypothetical protein
MVCGCFYDGESFSRCSGLDGWFGGGQRRCFFVPVKVLDHEVSGDDWKRDN